MRPLVIDDKIKSKIQQVVAYAKHHAYTMDDMLDIKNNQLAPAGDEAKHEVIIPFGYRVIYSVEEQPKLGRCHHLSISVDTKGQLPNVGAVEMIAKEFGLDTPLFESYLSIEEFVPGWHAVNVVSKI